MGPQQEHAETV
jgi:ribonuclease HI